MIEITTSQDKIINTIMPNLTLDSTQYFFQTQSAISSHKPTLVLVHGSGGDSSVWEAQLKTLSNIFHIIAVDLPSHGQSQGRPAIKPDDYAYWLKQLFNALNLPPLVLAGHSLGGIIAQQFAYMFPEMLRGLVLVGTGMRFDIPSGYLELIKEDFNSACLMSCKEAYASQPSPALLERGLSMLHNNGPDILLNDLLLCGNFDSRTWAHTLSTPCLIMCGKQDTITPCHLSKELYGTLPKSTLHNIDTCGHMVMQEQPDQCSNAIASFIHSSCSFV